MGLTIHYQGQLRSEAAYDIFIVAVRNFSAICEWTLHLIAERDRQLTRTLQPEDPKESEIEEVYVGPTRGLYLLPHSACEPLTFEFDQYLFMQNSTKTQFAGPETHATILKLFRQTEDLFEMLDVQDEAGFWEADDTEASRTKLVLTFAQTRAAIDEAAAETPGSSVAVLTPSGRIFDILAE